MGWVATAELVAASSNAGAFGFLGAATIPPTDVGREIERTRKLTDQPFGVNFLMDAPGADRISAAIIANRVRAAGYNRAPRPELIEELKAAGVVCIPTCGTLRHARKAEKLGADAIIVQGGEGGGHTGPVPSTILISQCADAVEVPIIAAGGFKDGRGLVAALAFGADGIAMGTRFVLTRESPVPESTTDRFLAALVTDVIVTREIDGLPQRVVSNELVARLESSLGLMRLPRALRSALEYRRASGATIYELLRAAFSLRRSEKLSRAQMLMAANAPMLAKRAMQDGDPVGGYLPGGTIAGVIADRPPCAELIEGIIREAEQTLRRLASLGNEK